MRRKRSQQTSRSGSSSKAQPVEAAAAQAPLAWHPKQQAGPAKAQARAMQARVGVPSAWSSWSGSGGSSRGRWRRGSCTGGMPPLWTTPKWWVAWGGTGACGGLALVDGLFGWLLGKAV